VLTTAQCLAEPAPSSQVLRQPPARLRGLLGRQARRLDPARLLRRRILVEVRLRLAMLWVRLRLVLVSLRSPYERQGGKAHFVVECVSWFLRLGNQDVRVIVLAAR
jgi:hypothetical protein